MSSVRSALAAVGLLAVPFAAAAAVAAGSPGTHSVACGESIATTKFPYLGSSQPRNRYRLVLGVASVPPAYQQQVVATHELPWRYHRKAGLVIRAGTGRVTVTVPKGWRTRAAITWGNGGQGVFSSVRFTGCGSNPKSGNAYAGGFYLASPSACLPLLVRVGTRSRTVRFGIGQTCS
jgi:hypothetical protein